MHSHIGDAPSPELEGAMDDNSWKGVVQPWLRALDGLNTHDDSFHLSIAGGVTTSLVLPESANGIGETHSWMLIFGKISHKSAQEVKALSLSFVIPLSAHPHPSY